MNILIIIIQNMFTKGDLMYSVTKSFDFEAGHRLSKHKKKCKYFHGHNYRIEVTLTSKNLNENDMVVDFGDLKKIVNELLKPFDHGMILNEKDPYINELPDESIILTTFETDPTAEAMTKYFFEGVDRGLTSNNIHSTVKVTSVKVWETPTSFAEYTED